MMSRGPDRPGDTYPLIKKLQQFMGKYDSVHVCAKLLSIGEISKYITNTFDRDCGLYFAQYSFELLADSQTSIFFECTPSSRSRFVMTD